MRELKNRFLSVKVTESQYEELVRIAAEERRTISSLVQIVLEDWAKERAARAVGGTIETKGVLSE